MFRVNFKLFLIILNINKIFAINLNKLKINDSANNNAMCFVNLIQKYYQSNTIARSSEILITIASNETDLQTEILRIFNDEFNLKYSFILNDLKFEENNLIGSNHYQQLKNFVLLIDNYTDIECTILKLKSKPNWNPMANILIILIKTLRISSEINLSIKSTLNYLINHHYIYNNIHVSAVLSDNYSNLDELMIWYQYQNVTDLNNLNISNTTISCNNMSDMNSISELFDYAKQLQKINSRSLDKLYSMKIVGGNWSPYAYYLNDGTNTNVQYQGIEINILETIAQHLQFVLQFEIHNITLNNYNINYINYNSSLMRKYDIIIGGLMDPFYNVFLNNNLISTTISYTEDDITWCVAKAKPKSVTWSNFDILAIDMWILIWLPLVFGWPIIYFLSRLEKMNLESYATLGIAFSSLIGLPTLYQPKRSITRLIYIFFVLTGFLFNSFYCSLWLRVISINRFHTQIRTIDDAIYFNFNFAIDSNLKYHLCEIYENSHPIQSLIKYCNDTDDCFKQLAYDDKLSVGISRKHAMNNQLMSKSKLFCFEKSNTIYSYPVVLFTRKNYPLLPIMNKLIRRFAENGLIDKWEREHSLIYKEKIQIVKPAILTSQHFIGST